LVVQDCRMAEVQDCRIASAEAVFDDAAQHVFTTVETILIDSDRECRRSGRVRGFDETDHASAADQAARHGRQLDRDDQLFGRNAGLVGVDQRAGRTHAATETGVPFSFVRAAVPHRQAQTVIAGPRGRTSLAHTIIGPIPMPAGRLRIYADSREIGRDLLIVRTSSPEPLRTIYSPAEKLPLLLALMASSSRLDAPTF